MSSISEKVIADLRPRPFTPLAKAWLALLFVICAIGLYAYFLQLRDGLVVTGLRDYTTWGIYIVNFVFFVAISLVGSLISAILKLARVSWLTPLTRISEVVAFAAIVISGIAIVVDMGRPDRMLNVLFDARLQSPITWDVMVISTYMALCFLFLFVSLIPDMALYRDDQKLPKWIQKVYTLFSFNWTGSDAQRAIINRSIYILAVLIIPVAVGMRMVSSLLFTTTTKPGWDSTNMGPYFVAGAFVVGAASFIVVMILCRKLLHLSEYFTNKHIDYLSKMLVLLLLIYLFFNINEYFSPAYKMKSHEAAQINDLFFGSSSLMFWGVQIVGLVLPIIILLFKWGRRPRVALVVSSIVVIGAWFKWYLIIVPALSHPAIPTDRSPYEWTHYMPSWEEWAITGLTLALGLLIVTYLLRIFPVAPVVKIIKERESKMLNHG